MAYMRNVLGLWLMACIVSSCSVTGKKVEPTMGQQVLRDSIVKAVKDSMVRGVKDSMAQAARVSDNVDPHGDALNYADEAYGDDDNDVDDNDDVCEPGSVESGVLLGFIKQEGGYTNVRMAPSMKADLRFDLRDGCPIHYRVYNAEWVELIDEDGEVLGYIHASKVVARKAAKRKGGE